MLTANAALVNNATIPFPGNGLGVIVHYNPAEFWYITAGIADAQADYRDSGFETVFDDEDYYFSMTALFLLKNFVEVSR